MLIDTNLLLKVLIFEFFDKWVRYKETILGSVGKEFKPCFKHYLGKHVKSQFALVPMTEWEIAIFLPIEQFKKKGKQAVWRESLKIARR